MQSVLWWIRRDLRLADNQALHAALSAAPHILPVCILDPKLWQSRSMSEKRLAFYLDGLRALDAALRARGSRLVIRRGNPEDELSKLRDESDAIAIFAEGDVSPYARQRDAAITSRLPLRIVGGLSVYPPEAVKKKDGTPYTVYTPFSRAWKALPRPQAEDILPAPDFILTLNEAQSVILPDFPQHPERVPFVAGEAEAQRRLAAFASDRIFRYSEDRNCMDVEGTSHLSPYLRFGMLSVRQVAVAAHQAMAEAETRDARANAETWLNELIWREFYQAILYHFPHVRRENFREATRGLQWEPDPAAFERWREGRTGYPVVDAGMRQLLATGWMHNRARMIVASFLTKDLLIDWRWGERHFMQHLIDGDPAANNGGWQWAAGTGADAAPYFRIFNPSLQGQKYDPQGDYVRRWAPELARVPGRYIHQPWTMPESVQEESRCHIGKAYPRPIVDHAWARERALRMYKAARAQ